MPGANFDDLALPLYDSLYRFARWLTGSDADAEDLVQESYLKAFRAFATFQPGSNFRAWIFRILKNTFLSSCTSGQRGRNALIHSDELMMELPSDLPDPLTLLVHRARLDAVHVAIDRLPEAFREVLLMCAFEETSYRDTAQALSIPLGTVMSRLARARSAIRDWVHAAPNPYLEIASSR